MRIRKKIAICLIYSLLISCLAGGSNEKNKSLAQELSEDFTSSTAIQNPRVVEDENLVAGYRTTWDCVWFGSFPQKEVIPSDMEYDAIHECVSSENDTIVSDEEYELLENATGWDENGDIVIRGQKYRRLCKEDVFYPNTRSAVRCEYFWGSVLEYRYFKYEPLKWRVLSVEDGKLLLLADIAIDSNYFEPNQEKTLFWDNSTLRSYLNTEFYKEAFNSSERQQICTTTLQTRKYWYEDEVIETTDDIFLLSTDDVDGEEASDKYGFVSENHDYEPYFCYSSTYAKARGILIYSPSIPRNYSRVCSWWLRGAYHKQNIPVVTSSPTTPGATDIFYRYEEHAGNVEPFGKASYRAESYYYGVRPALYLDNSTAQLYQYAGTVSTDGSCMEIEKSENTIFLSNPKVSTGSSIGEKNVTWDKISFGSYPQAEVVSESDEYTALDSRIRYQGDVIFSDELYQQLEQATEWDESGKIEINGEFYQRITAKDSIHGKAVQHLIATGGYTWEDSESYHYFKYEPLEWRVLQNENGKVFLLADRILDCVYYDMSGGVSTWEKSTVRSWLNGYDSSQNSGKTDYTQNNFLNIAFNQREQEMMEDTLVHTECNPEYGTGGGGDTTDKLFLLSLQDVDAQGKGAEYGFLNENDRRNLNGLHMLPSAYASAKGVNISGSVGDDYAAEWWLRSRGSYNMLAALVGFEPSTSGQYSYMAGMGVRPAMYLSIEDTTFFDYVGTVSNDGTEWSVQVSQEEGPKQTESPLPSETAIVTNTPADSEKPAGTMSPEPTVPTKSPQESVEPVASKQPQETDTPEITETPDNPAFYEEVSLPRISAFTLKETRSCNVKVNWKKVDEVQMYYIYRSEKKKGTYTLIRSVNSANSSYIDKNVTLGKTYYYKVIPWAGGDRDIQLDMAVCKKITVHYLAQPSIQVKKAKTSSGQRYVEISLKKYQGDYAEIYYKTKEEVKYHKLKIKKKRISVYRQKFRLRYEKGGVTLCFKVRTYVVKKGQKKYSRYSKETRKKI